MADIGLWQLHSDFFFGRISFDCFKLAFALLGQVFYFLEMRNAFDFLEMREFLLLEKRSDGRLKFQRSCHLITESKSSDAQVQKYQNSYRLDTNKPFKIDPVDKIVKTVMMNRLEDEIYDPNQCPKLCSQVASEIRKKILKLDYERYKIVVVVSIIEKASQSLETSMGFVWDTDRDNYSTYTFETQTFFAYCLVTGTYYE